MENTKTNWRHLCLGTAINILVAINFILLYNAYIQPPSTNYNFSNINPDKIYGAQAQKISPAPTSPTQSR